MSADVMLEGCHSWSFFFIELYSSSWGDTFDKTYSFFCSVVAHYFFASFKGTFSPASLKLVHLLLWFLIWTRVRSFFFTLTRMGLGLGNHKWLDPHGTLRTPGFQLNGHPGDCQDRSWRENWSNYLDHSGRRISEAFFFFPWTIQIIASIYTSYWQ